jgi:O-antigen/teichoic acid export membrane protein
MAYRQAELSYYAIADPVATVTFPAFAQMRQRRIDITHSFLTALRLVALLACPVGILLSAGARPFTEAIFGPKWLPMAGPLAVLGIWAIARPLQVTVGRLLNSLGAAWMYGRISMVALAPFAVATVCAVKLGGINAVAWVLLVYIVIVGALLMRVVARRADIAVRSQWRVLRPLFVASAVGWLATRATADALDAAPPMLAFAACVIVCIGTYAGTVRLGDPHVFGIAVHQVKRALGREATGTGPEGAAGIARGSSPQPAPTVAPPTVALSETLPSTAHERLVMERAAGRVAVPQARP